MSPETDSFPAGTVALVGAGPGAPDLITVRGLERLRRADVVLHDRLASPELLLYASDGAVLIDVGKRPGGRSTAQATIHRLLVEHARLGRRVVRLKGGDPYVFGRGGEERQACVDAGVPCEVVPGITSALAAPAAAGIPVTHRGVSPAFTVVTGHRSPEAEARMLDDLDRPEPLLDWSGLARRVANGETLVILMGVSRLSAMSDALIRAGASATTPAAAIENATLPEQRVLRCDLVGLPELASREGLCAPAVLVIGRAAAESLRQDASVGQEATAAALHALAAASQEPDTPRLERPPSSRPIPDLALSRAPSTNRRQSAREPDFAHKRQIAWNENAFHEGIGDVR